MISASLLSHIRAEAPATDENSTFPQEAFRRITDEGLLHITLPGGELDFHKPCTASLLHLLRDIGSADLPTGRIYEGHINALYLIHLFADEVSKQCWYDEVKEKAMIFGVWNTQAGNGVRIRDNGDGTCTLQGEKTFCSGAGAVHRPLITGELEGAGERGWQMCILPVEELSVRAEPGFWKPMGMKASVSYGMDFSGISISRENLLGPPGAYYRQPAFSGGSIRFSAVQLGGAQALLTATIRYLQDLGRTDDAFQKARVAEMTWLVTSGNQWLDHAGNNTDRWLKEGNKTAEIQAYANMTRTAIEEICLRTMELAGRCVGARGLMRSHPFERTLRDLSVYLKQPAPDASLTAIADFVCHPDQSAHELWS